MKVKSRTRQQVRFSDGVRIFINDAKRTFVSNWQVIITVFEIITPFAFLFFGQVAYSSRNYFAVGGEYLIAAPAWLILLAVLRNCAKRQNIVNGMPVPYERFTTTDKDEVSIDYDRMNDLLLYVAELEDWMDDEGYL